MWRILNLLGIKDPNSGNLLTVHEAIKAKIFEVDQATLVVEPGQDPLSLEEALKRNVIDTKLHDNLKALSDLSKKYEINLSDKEDPDEIDGSEKRVKVIEFNQNGAKSVAEATEEGSVDSASGLFRLSNGTYITINEAYKYGYLITNETVKVKSTPMSFSDALSRGLFDESGSMVDRNSGAKHQLHSAIANNLINDNLREIVDIKNDEKLTVKRAMALGLLDSKNGLFKNSLSNESCTFNYAHNSHLISKPLTFKDLVELELIKDNNKILSPTFTKWLSIQEAIEAGVLDFDNFKCVTREKGSLLTLSEAIDGGIITLEGDYKDVVTGETLSLKHAVDRGLISSVAQKSIFDIDGFRDPQEETFVSFNMALRKRILRRDDKRFVLISSDNRFLSLDEGLEAGLVRPEVFSMLMRHIGVFDKDRNELRVIDLAFYKLIDPASGYLVDLESGRRIPLDDAIESQLITASGALLLSSLLSITLTTETITKTIKRYVTIRDNSVEKDSVDGSNGHPSFSEAVQKGLISIDEQTYRQPDEGQFYLVQDALNSDRVLADTEVLPGTPRRATLTIVTKSFSPTLEQSSSPTSHSMSLDAKPKSLIKILKKMQKKVISLSDALHMGLINAETYELLENNATFVNNPDSFLKSKKYKLKDPQSGASLTLEEAIEREILNPNNITKFYIPFCKSLSIPQLIERDLLDADSQKVIHPETGDLLTINEAVACDIVDKYSLIKNDKKHKIMLKDAIKSDYLDGHSAIIKTKRGDLSIKGAIERGLFEVEKSKDKSKTQHDIPLIGQTFPVVVKRNLFDPIKREVIHKTSNARTPIKKAIESDYIMSVPCTPNHDEIYIIDALDQSLIDFEHQLFRNPQTGSVMSLFDAYNKGFLIAKPLHAIIAHESLKSTQVTKEVKNVSHTVKTKSIDILDGWTMISANEILNNKTGEVIALDVAKDQGVAIERVEVNQFTTSQLEEGNIPESLTEAPAEHGSITQVTVLIDPKVNQKSFQPETSEDFSESQTTSTSHLTIKKITMVKEILVDENGREISSEVPERFEKVSESTLPADDVDFQEIIARFKEENPDFENIDHEDIFTSTSETVVTKVVKEYNIVKNETEIFSSSWKEGDVDEGVEALEPELFRIVKETSPDDHFASNQKTYTTVTTTKHFGSTDIDPTEEAKTSQQPSVSETTQVEELPEGDRKTIVITTTRVISNKNVEESTPEEVTPDQYQAVTSETSIDDESASHGKTTTIITSIIKSVTEKFSDDDEVFEPVELVEPQQQAPAEVEEIHQAPLTKKNKNLSTLTSQFLDNERNQKTPVPAPRSKKMVDVEPPQQQEVPQVETRFSDDHEVDSQTTTTQHVTTTIVVKTLQEIQDQSEPATADNDDGHLKHLEKIVVTTLSETDFPSETKEIESEEPLFQEPIEPLDISDKVESPESFTTTVTSTTTTIITTMIQEPDQVDIISQEIVEKSKPEPIALVSEVPRTSTSRESSPPDGAKSPTSELVKVKQFTVAENIIEVIPLRDAIKQGKIAPKICRIMDDGNELPLTVHDALKAKQLTPTDVVQIISSHVVVLVKDSPKEYLLNFNDSFSEQKLREVGLYDRNVPSFVDPWTGNQISFKYFVFQLDVLDPSIFVKNQKLETYVPIQQAFDESLMDPQLGTVTDTKANKNLSIFEAVDRKFVIQRPHQDKRILKRPTTFDDLLKHGGINFEADEFLINNENLTMLEALRRGALDTETISIRDPATSDVLGFKFAEDRGIVDLRRGVVINLITFEETLMIVAYRRGYLLIGRVQPISLNAAINSGFYDKSSNKIKNPFNNELLSLQDAISYGLIDPKLTDVKDTKSNKFVLLKEAIEFNLVDPKVGMIKNKKSAVPLDKAVKEKLIFNKTEPFDLAEIITRNYYDPQTGKMLNPYTNKYVTIREAISLKIINIHYIRIYDVVQDRVFTVDEAITNGLFDDKNGVITRPRLTLDKAYLQRIIISFNGPLSLPSALNCNLFDRDTRKFSFNDKNLNLSEAIEHNKIAGNELVLYDPNRQRLSTLNDAISAGFLDPIESVIVDPITNKEVPIDDAMEQGLLVQSRSDVNLRDAVFDGLYDPESGSFSNVTSNEKLPLESAINRNVIDVKSTVMNVNNVTLDFEQAVEQGLIDPQNSLVKTKSGENLNLIEAFDQGILNTISKPVRLHEAVIKQLYDETSGLFTDPETRRKITMQESIQESLIDPNSIQIQDPGSKSYLPISINFAIQTGLINGKDGRVTYDNQTYALKDAFDLGILIDSKGPVSIQRTIHQGSFDENLGRIADPFSGKNITVHEAMRKFVVNPQLPCYFDEEKEKLLSLNETCKRKLIDRFQGDFTVPFSGEKLTLNEAMKQDWIVDIESGHFSLYKTLLLGMVNIPNGKFVHPVTNRELSLNQAIEQDLIDPNASLIKNRNGKYFSLTDALRFGIVDGVRNLYWLTDSQSIPLMEAMEKGLIVSNEKPFSLRSAIEMRLYRPDTGKFVDPTTNTFVDLKSGIDGNLINKDSTQFKNLLTKQIKPLTQAIIDGDINVAKGRVFDQKSGSSFNYDAAMDKGLLIHAPRGSVTPKKEVVHEVIPEIRIDLSESGKPREMTLDEVIKADILNPETALIKDPQTGKFILLRVYIEKYQINLTQKALINPNSSFFTFGPHCVVYTREPKSFDDVIESKQLNLATGKLVDPQNEEKVCTIQEAIEAGILDPDTILIKDGSKNKLMRVSEALRKGLIDPERSHVVDTVSSKLYNLENALQEGLLKTPKMQFDLLEALQFNLYDPTTGHFTDPFAPTTEDLKVKAQVTFEEALAKGLIDTSTTMVRTSQDSEIIAISAAITSGVIDPISGKIVIKSQDGNQTESIDFVRAKELDLLVPAGERVR